VYTKRSFPVYWPTTTEEKTMRVIGYVRVSTEEQAESRAGMKAQKAGIAREARARGWDLVRIVEDAGFSAKDLRRPGIIEALGAVEAHEADALVVAKLDRLSRSLLDFATLMERARRKGWALVALDLGVDTTTPAGEMVANVMATFAQFERRLIGQRTRDALEVKRSEGVVLGRPRALPRPVRSRIKRMRRQGATFATIADRLTADRVPTAHGGKRWYPSTVRAVAEG
jgi:DNA invertase Pin-like site-specific DNA recombinase